MAPIAGGRSDRDEEREREGEKRERGIRSWSRGK